MASQQQITMVVELLEYDGETGARRLTDWEIKFLEDIKHIVDGCFVYLSTNQASKLDQIWQEIFR